jgi:hypothetical protein
MTVSGVMLATSSGPLPAHELCGQYHTRMELHEPAGATVLCVSYALQRC